MSQRRSPVSDLNNKVAKTRSPTYGTHGTRALNTDPQGMRNNCQEKTKQVSLLSSQAHCLETISWPQCREGEPRKSLKQNALEMRTQR